jgi:hypothetical protein
MKADNNSLDAAPTGSMILQKASVPKQLHDHEVIYQHDQQPVGV